MKSIWPLNLIWDPKRGAKKAFGIPYAYIERVFRLDHDIYVPEYKVEKALGDILGINPGFMRNPVSRIFRPPVEGHDYRKEELTADNPLRTKQSGAIIHSYFNDLAGRKGLAVAILPPHPLGALPPETRGAIFGFYGYYDDEGYYENEEDFQIHKIVYPYFNRNTQRQTSLSDIGEHMMYEGTISQRFAFAEKVTGAMFQEEPVNQLYNAWKQADQTNFRNKEPVPWEQEKKKRDETPVPGF